ncbi:hypothetical protein BMS3Bbin01_02073 [bacterium BMS3Bbin01]|nr:hypothetical protein BMS3Bbin01_02073 [bacterium BMS3Bbin01]
MAVGLAAGRDLLQARNAAASAVSAAQMAATSIGRGDLSAAAREIAGADADLQRAESSLDRVEWAEAVPLIGEDIEAFRSAIEASRQLTAAADVIFGFMNDRPLLVDDGRFDPEVFASLRQTVTTARDHAGEAQRLLGSAPRPRLASLREPLDRLRTLSSSVFTGLDSARALSERLEPAVSGDAPFRVLLLIENEAELRATGGFFGFPTLVEINRGEIKLVRVDGFGALQVRDDVGRFIRVDAPSDYVTRYGSFLANTSLWVNVNLSPDFPTVAGVAGRLYEAAIGIRPDAVVRIDLTGVGYLLDAFGGVSAGGVPIGGDTLATDFIIDSYRRFPDNVEQSAYLVGVLRTVFRQVLTARDADGAALVAALRRAVAERRLAVVTGVPAIDSGLAAAGADGSILPGDPGDLNVIVQNFGANKMDLFTSETIDVDVSVAGCAVIGTVSVTITNGTPAWAAALPALYDDNEGRWWVNVYLPADAMVLSVTENGTAVPATQAREVGRPVLARLTTIAAGDSSVVAVRYQEVVSGTDYRVRVEPQPLIHPAMLRFNGSDGIVLATTATHTYMTDCKN